MSQNLAVPTPRPAPPVTPRDLDVLALIAQQCTITHAQLARLIGRSERTARWLRDRWQRAGWVESRVLLVGVPAFIWLTPQGQRVCGASFKPWRPSAAGRLPHLAACTDARLMVARRRPDAIWTSERELMRAARRERAPRSQHMPDAAVALDGRTAAIEVELTPKQRTRTESIARELLARYDAVWYFTTDATQRQLEDLAARAGFERLQVLALDGAADAA